MASSDLGIARAVFTAALMTIDDAVTIRREDITVFTKTLLRVMNKCTNADVKTCKSFILRRILPSEARTAAFTKYILVLAKSCTPSDRDTTSERSARPDAFEGLDERTDGKPQLQPHTMFRRLHLLLVVHDVLAFVAVKLQKNTAHARDQPVSSTAIEHLQSTVPTLAQLAVCSDDKPSPAARQARETVDDLLTSWEKHEVLPRSVTESLHTSIQSASKADFSDLIANFANEEAQAALAAQRAKQEATKWIVPQSHQLPNDPSAPWHELPAANGLYQKRTRGYPLTSSALPQGGYRLRNGGREADADMQAEVQSLLNEAKRCFDRYTDPAEVQDVDALGNIVWKDGVQRKRRNCWGWSYDGIEKRRKLVPSTRPR